MPTQENLEGSPSEREAVAVEKKSTNATQEPTQDEMTKEEALAVLWTGVETLAKMKAANLYHSRKTGRVVIELLAVEYSPKLGIVSVGRK